MPLRNRVNPMGDLVATPERGAWTGNRGVLINRDRQLTRAWRLQRWLICRLEYKALKRSVWTPGRWTELFFLDEATALSAGHRPCAYCRYPDAVRFRRIWSEVNGPVKSLVELDAALHQARQCRHRAQFGELPAGAMIALDGEPYLVSAGQAHRWSFAGYREPIALPDSEEVAVLTPQPIIRVLQGGYHPQIAPALQPTNQM